MEDFDIELARFGTIATIVADAKEKLLNTFGLQYFTIDTGFLDPNGFGGMWRWFEANLQRLVKLGEEVAAHSSPHRFHRLFIVPDPAEYPNNFQRSLYRRIVQDVLHFHLWHGVVVYVVFIRREDYDATEMLRAADLGALGNQIVHDTANYHAKSFRGLRTVEGANASAYVTRALGTIHSEDLRGAIRLYYDGKTFEHGRREDKQWQNLRTFFYRLQGGICPGPECAALISRREAALDHVIPRTASNNVLLNLRVLCARCNSNKWKFITHEIPFAAAYEVIPRNLATEQIKHIISDSAPPWLPRCGRPPIDIFPMLGV